MTKAMIITVGGQANQIVFSLKKNKPDFIGLIATSTDDCKKAIQEIEKERLITALNSKILYTRDHPSQIGVVVNNVNELYKWLTSEKRIPREKIILDPTGGRKWMSGGMIMFASFLELNMVYVHTGFKDGRPNPSEMEVVHTGNAHKQVGFMEEERTDKLLFNTGNYRTASEKYKLLANNADMPRKLEIKKEISEGFYCWEQFCFKEAYKCMGKAAEKLNTFSEHLKEFKKKLSPFIKNYLKILANLKINDEKREEYFKLIKTKNFVNDIICHLWAQAERCENHCRYEQGALLLYRIIEFITQACLAKHNIDSESVTKEIQKSYNDKFKQISKEVNNAESEIPDKIALLQSMILLFCLGDELIKEYAEKKDIKFLKGLKEKLKTRNLLWPIHKNHIVESQEYEKFKKYIEFWINKFNPQIFKSVKKFWFVKFSGDEITV